MARNGRELVEWGKGPWQDLHGCVQSLALCLRGGDGGAAPSL